MTQNSPQSAHRNIDEAQSRVDRLDEHQDNQFNNASAGSVLFKGIDDFQSRLNATLPEEKHGKYLNAVAQNLEAITGPETLQATMQLIGTQLDRFEADLEANQEVMGYSREYMTGRERASNSSFEDIEDMPMAQLKEGYAYAPFLIKMMKDFEDWGGSDKEAQVAKEMIDKVAIGLEATKAQLGRADMEESPAYQQLKEAYAKDLQIYVSVIANVGDSFESPAFREEGKKGAEEEQKKFERIAKYSQEALRVMPLDEGITWVKDLMRQIDANDWQSEGLKATYGSLARNCRMGLKAKLNAERSRMKPREYERHALDLANLFTDREGAEIDSDLVDPGFAAEMLKSSINFQELATAYAERQGKTNPLKAEIAERKGGVISHIEGLSEEQKALPQIQKAVELINGNPPDMKGLASQYAVIRSWEAQIKGEKIPNIQQEVSDHMELFIGEALQSFGKFLDSGATGADVTEIQSATGAKFSPEQIKAYELLAEIEGFGMLDLSDNTWNTTAEFAKVGAMIAAGVAVGIATGGAGFAIAGSAVLGSAVVGGTTMTAAGALLYQKGFDDWKEATRVYGADLATNAVGFGAARVLQAGRLALQLRKAGMLDEAASVGKQTKEIFRMANTGGTEWKSLMALDDSMRLSTRMLGASAEAVCDYGVSSVCDTVVNTYILGEGSFMENLGKAFTDPMNIGFLGVGVGMDLSPTVMKNLRAALGKAEPETLHGMDQALNKAMNAKQHLAGILKTEGIAWQDFAKSSHPEASIAKLPPDQQAAAREHLQDLRTAQAEFTDTFQGLDLPAKYTGVDAGEARLAREGGMINLFEGHEKSKTSEPVRVDLAVKASPDFIPNLEQSILIIRESLSSLNQRKSSIEEELSVLSEHVKTLKREHPDQYEMVQYGGGRVDQRIIMSTRPRPGTEAAQATEKMEALKKQLSEVGDHIHFTKRQLEISTETLADAHIAGTPDGIKKKIQELRQEREDMEDQALLNTPEGRQRRQDELSDLDRQIASLEKRLDPTRLAIGTMVLVPRSNGSFTEAKVVEFDEEGSAITEWIENGQKTKKAVSPEKLEPISTSPKKQARREAAHLRLDSMTMRKHPDGSVTGMRQKELLFLPEGIASLREKFGDSMEMLFGDVTGMGVGNDMLRRPGEGADVARNRVDHCFTIMNEVADKIFGTDMTNRPFEIVRMGGDEIMFLSKKGDARLDDFFNLYNQRKKEYLMKEIGEDVYEKARTETNVKGQMKLITKDPTYEKLAAEGNTKGIRAFLFEELGKHGVDFRTLRQDSDGRPTPETRMGPLLRVLSEKRYEVLQRNPDYVPLEPLDFYRPPQTSTIGLQRLNHNVRIDLMEAIAKADSDIAWLKGHPGEKFPSPREYDDAKIKENAEKYLDQAENTEATIRSIQEKEIALAEARERGDRVSIETLTKEIIRLETIDPGSGAIRLDRARDRKISDFMEGPTPKEIVVTRMDIPYFGVFNNHLSYAQADEFMTRINKIYTERTGGTIVRDGGNLVCLSRPEDPSFDIESVQREINQAIADFMDQPGVQQVRAKMDNEVTVKQAISHTNDEFGKVKFYPTQNISLSQTGDTKLWDIVNPVL